MKSVWARPSFKVHGKGKGRLARLMYRDGFNAAEIGHVLGKPRAHVSRLLHRGQRLERVR